MVTKGILTNYKWIIAGILIEYLTVHNNQNNQII